MDAQRGIYLYCLARPACLSVVTHLAEQGVDERFPVSAVARDGLVAVVGEVDPREFHDQNLQKLDWVAPRACRHEAVVEAIMGASPILPVRFGTIFGSVEPVTRLLAEHRETVSAFLDKLRDKVEWSVKGYLDEAKARRAVVAADRSIQDRLASLPESPGSRYFQQKLVDAMIAAALREWVGRRAHAIGEALRGHAVEAVELRLLPGGAAGRSERMIYNGSFLVTHAALPAFRAAVAGQAEAGREAGLTLELKGPWPPYHFCPKLERDPLPLEGGGEGGGERTVP